MGNVVAERVAILRENMKQAGISWYFFTSDDFHASEYVADYFKIREHYSGFTGENAFLLVGEKNAYLWTDGRFFIQADIELKGTGIELMKMGEPGVPTVSEFIEANVKGGEVLAFDGRMVSTALGKKLESVIQKNGASLLIDKDVAGSLWMDRPSMPVSKLLIFDETVTGESVESKLSRIREAMKKADAKYHFIASLDDIAWITNMRGADIECNPVFLSYMLISDDDCVIFMEEEEATAAVKEYLSKKNIKVESYLEVASYLDAFKFDGKILLNEAGVNFATFKILSKKAELINAKNPSNLFKSIKNKVEIERLKKAYVDDSVCVTKFIYWLKNAIKNTELTEISAAEYLDNLRRQVPGFLDLSFPTISGYGTNGAIVHYSATKESNATLKPEGMLLVDSGGQYENGTTDITRTISLGPVTDKMKLFYTKVAIGTLSLAKAKFLYGCTGRNLDILSRASLWNMGMDYKHGTGHGVGYILNVHEGPQNIRWKFIEGMTESVLEPGMITSDEPGVYIEGEFGIRIENIILCVEDFENEYGKFLKFEHLTYTPLDRELLDTSVLTSSEIEMINEYQENVYQKTKDLLTNEEANWLREVTRPL